MADVGYTLHGGATHVDRRRPRSQRDELAQAARRGVVQVQAHADDGTDTYFDAVRRVDHPAALTRSTVATAATPSPRPVRPRPSVVVPDTEIGPPRASDSTCWASARRVLTRGALPITCTAPLATVQPWSASLRRTSVSSSAPCAPAHRWAAVPNTAPRSPNPAADSAASHNACAATSPSEWPAQPGTPGQFSPAIQQARSGCTGCTSVPIPTLMSDRQLARWSASVRPQGRTQS